MFRTVNVNPYRKPLGGTNETHQRWTVQVQGSLNNLMPNAPDVLEVDVYSMNGQYEEYSAGSPRRFVIFGNLGHPRANQRSSSDVFLNHRDDTLHILDEEENVIAEFDKANNELFILFNVFNDVVDATSFNYIMKKLDELYYLPLTFENSWLHTSDRTKLTETLTKTMRDQRGRFINEEKQRIDGWKQQINEFRNRIKQNLDRIQSSNNVVTVEEQQLASVGAGLLKDLDLIVQHEKVKDLHIKDNKFIVYTNPLYMYTSKDERFYLGNMRIELDPSTSDVRFYGDNPRRGYWTDHDPHPHVDGNGGGACLGNASSLIAELSHQMQLYPLALTAIDFLEQANVEDAAGRKVYNWDEVDEEGNIIRKGGEPKYIECYHCGEAMNPNDTHTVYGYIDDDGPGDQREVCDDCRENRYTWDDDAEVYVQD